MGVDPEDTASPITLTASDQDGDPLTYSIVTGPSHGTLSGTPPNLTYTPGANYNGSDSFTFKANDGTGDSTAAMVSFTVTAVNDAPVASDQSVSTAEDTPMAITVVANNVAPAVTSVTGLPMLTQGPQGPAGSARPQGTPRSSRADGSDRARRPARSPRGRPYETWIISHVLSHQGQRRLKAMNSKPELLTWA